MLRASVPGHLTPQNRLRGPSEAKKRPYGAFFGKADMRAGEATGPASSHPWGLCPQPSAVPLPPSARYALRVR